MEQTQEDEREDNGPPAKRRRLSHTEDGDTTSPSRRRFVQSPKPIATVANGSTSVDEDQIAKEIKAGITSYVNPDAPGFTGILKQRYTDFLVNEILPNGRVLHLENQKPPKRSPEETGKSDKGQDVAALVDNDAHSKLSKRTEDKAERRAKTDDKGSLQATSEQAEEGQISSEDRMDLTAIFGNSTTDSIISLYTAALKNPKGKSSGFDKVTTAIISDKDDRGKAHQAIRRIFSSRFETTTQDDGQILVKVAPNAGKTRGGRNGSGGVPRVRDRLSWQELGGDYLHFTLYKENKDTMEVVMFLASQLRVGAKGFQFSGTKDRRGVTVQRVSAYRVHAERLAAVGSRMYGSKIGDYEYRPDGLELGELGGNEFLITLRGCHFPGEEGLKLTERIELADKLVNQSMESFRKGGFINYFGLQRFGSFATGTDAIGTKLLQGNLKGAIEDILSYSAKALAAAQANKSAQTLPTDTEPNESTKGPETQALISSDDCARALAIHTWQTTQDSATALPLLPRKFSAESSIIRHLGQRDRRNKNEHLPQLNDHQGALQSIPRNMRLMYVHAYQSLVWNVVAGVRWEKFGDKVVEGDLVLVENIEMKKRGNQPNGEAMVDEAGEPIVLVSDTKRSLGTAGSSFERARPLSAAEAASGVYDIFDVVLPLPGFDVEYPPNAIGEVYKDFMKSERGGGLDPMNMRRNWKELSLSGNYRKLLGRCPSEALKAEIRVYKGEEQLVETDAQRLEKKSIASQDGKSGAQNGAHEEITQADAMSNTTDAEEKIAVVVQLRLAPGQYATMALRELMKQGGVRTYKSEYTAGR